MSNISKLLELIKENNIDEFSKLLNQDSEEKSLSSTSMLDKHYLQLLKTAALISGRECFLESLTNAGLDVNLSSSNGYTVLHLCTIWGRVESLKTLVRLGANPKLCTFYKESSKDLATRYNQNECLRFFDVCDFRDSFKEDIAYAKSILQTPENFTGKLTKDEKNRINKVCDEKNSWIDTYSYHCEFTEMKQQKEDFKTKLGTILDKMTPVKHCT